MPDVHVGAVGPCGLVATIGEWVNPQHVGVDIGCEVSMVFLNKKVPEFLYKEFEAKVKEQVKFGQVIHSECKVDKLEFVKFIQEGFDKYRSIWPDKLYELPKIVTIEYTFYVIWALLLCNLHNCVCVHSAISQILIAIQIQKKFLICLYIIRF